MKTQEALAFRALSRRVRTASLGPHRESPSEVPVYSLLTIPSIHRSNRKFTKITDVLTQPRPIRLKGRSYLALTL